MITGVEAVNATIRASRQARARNADALAARRKLRAKVRSGQEEDEDFESHPCFVLCVNCGRMDDPPAKDKYRANESALATRQPCRVCRRKSLVDLRHTPTVHSLHELVEYDSAARDSAGGRLALRAGTIGATLAVVAFIVVLFWALTTEYTFDPFYFTLMGIGMIPFALGAGNVALGHWRRSRAKPFPARWVLALRPANTKDFRDTTGAVEPVGPLLRAPVSGRLCVAYELGIRHDDNADQPDGTWLLLEQRSAAFRVSDMLIAKHHARLFLPRQPAPEEWKSGDAKAKRFLRERGFFISDDVHVFETILEPGERVTVSTSPKPDETAEVRPAR